LEEAGSYRKFDLEFMNQERQSTKLFAPERSQIVSPSTHRLCCTLAQHTLVRVSTHVLFAYTEFTKRRSTLHVDVDVDVVVVVVVALTQWGAHNGVPHVLFPMSCTAVGLVVRSPVVVSHVSILPINSLVCRCNWGQLCLARRQPVSSSLSCLK
jgi:hypothetical protein